MSRQAFSRCSPSETFRKPRCRLSRRSRPGVRKLKRPPSLWNSRQVRVAHAAEDAPQRGHRIDRVVRVVEGRGQVRDLADLGRPGEGVAPGDLERDPQVLEGPGIDVHVLFFAEKDQEIARLRRRPQTLRLFLGSPRQVHPPAAGPPDPAGDHRGVERGDLRFLVVPDRRNDDLVDTGGAPLLIVPDGLDAARTGPGTCPPPPAGPPGTPGYSSPRAAGATGNSTSG